jgi:hypothetical protein
MTENLLPDSNIVADKGYGLNWFRRKVWRKGIKPRIPKRKRNNKKYDPIWQMEGRTMLWLA